MAYTWRPSNDCYFSPLAVMNPAQYLEWATSIEAAAGPTLFVGDSLLTELFFAFKSLTNGAPNAKFHRANTLTNTHTLAPITVPELDACLDVAAPVPNTNALDPPCPPNQRSSLWWEDNRWHNMDNMMWTKARPKPDLYACIDPSREIAAAHIPGIYPVLASWPRLVLAWP
jgi:hypothetical protein